MIDTQWTNFFVPSLATKTSEGHIPASLLRKKIEEHDGSEAYHCLYDLEPRPDFKGYIGNMRPALGYVWFDFDSHDGGETALYDVRLFIEYLRPAQGHLIYYSGNKGFHVGVPFGYFGLEPSPDLSAQLSDISSTLQKTFKTLDTSIYNSNRKFRVPNSQNLKSGLYKVRILNLVLNIDQIRDIAKTRGDRTIAIPDTHVEPLPQLMLPVKVEVAPIVQSTEKIWDAPSGIAAFDQCGFLAHCRDNQTTITEPQWYGALSIVSRFKEGRKQCHGISYKHKDYSVSDCNEKIDQALNEALPRTCDNISKLWDGCKDCKLFGKINSPVNILTKEEKKELVAKKPKERDIALKLLVEYEGNLMRQNKSLFRYHEGHWKELTITQKDSIKKTLLDVYAGTATSRSVDSTFQTFFREVSPVPNDVNMFDANPFCANFKNGTLHIRQSRDFYYSTEFLPHNKKDYLNSVLPFDYIPENKDQNTSFLEMVERIFKGDLDKEEKIRAIRQMFGACLIPAFPRLFFLYGPSGCGKSTIMSIAKKFLSVDNISSVQPSKFSGFNLETMVGKLANIVTDVDTRQPITDSTIKMIIDRNPVYIERKGIMNIHGMLPAIHLFGGNAIPPTLEGALGAHTRRWTFIGFNNVQTSTELYNKEFPHWVFEQSPQGILNFALDGLNDLLAQRGHYTIPSSGKEKMQNWQGENDSLGLFLKDTEAGEVFGHEDSKNVALRFDNNADINRSKLYSIYVEWAEKSGHAKFTNRSLAAPLTRNLFYQGLEMKNYRSKIVRGERKFEGFSLCVTQGAEY